ncbi:ribonuclease Z [Candidatus Woesearchaeota archaeon]|nr:ribonuclease Z [Candidatus Woesearchaeota archaeon]
MELTLFGTSSMVPTKERNQSAVFLRYENEGFLFDCGEGTQKQFKIKGIPLTRITKIFLTHWHGDHVFGLPGVIASLGKMDYERSLLIVGPKGTKKHLEAMFSAFEFERNFGIEIREAEKGICFDAKGYKVECLPLDHDVPTVGYRFVEKDVRHIDMKKIKKIGLPAGPMLGKLADGEPVEHNGKRILPEEATFIEKGKKVAIVTDTAFCANAVKLAEDADLVVAEATFGAKLEEKSKAYKHMTGREAAQVASQAGAKKLVLTHFSARYKETIEVEEDAKDIFPDTIAGRDFMTFKI